MTPYKRILLKLSGEALLGKKEFGIDVDVLDEIAEQIKVLRENGIEIGIVIGGGNIFRGNESKELHIDRATADYMGMLATVINALALQNMLMSKGIDARVMSSLSLTQVAEPYILAKAVAHFNKGRVIIFAGGTGLPFFTTDTTAALRAIEIKADALFKATKVDAIYSADPKKDKNAKKYRSITYTEFLAKNLKAMDSTAVSLCRDFHMPIILFNMTKKNNLVKAVLEGGIGTYIKEG
ncbi:MAG: UMP kinase [Caldisericaceae bacterium]|nr:UMP kinase [Caldisericaceae bacterium]